MSTKRDMIAEAVSADIRSGRYAIGDTLPSENELSRRFGVSRHTVRAALRVLQDRGLVSSQQGVGTLVQQSRPTLQYSHGFTSAEDLLQYATNTRVRTLDCIEVRIGEELAAEFDCKPGEHWWRIRTVRTDPSTASALAYSEIHIPLAFGAVLGEARRGRQPIFALIQSRFGEAISEIQQEIACISRLADEPASQLGVASGSPAMQITRYYLGNGGRVLEVARSLHPSEVFKYSMRVQLRHGP